MNAKIRTYYIYILEVILASIIIFNGRLHLQPATIVFIFIISLFSAHSFEKKYQIFKNVFDTKPKLFVFVLLCLYSAFSLSGGIAFIYPVKTGPNPLGIFVYLVTVFWFVPVLFTILSVFEIYTNNFSHSPKRLNIRQFILILLLAILIPGFITLYTFNPGITSQDTFDTLLIAAHNIYGAHDWHPAFYSLMMHLIIKIWDSTYMVIIVQYIFYLYVILELFLYLRKRGISDTTLIIFAVFTGLNSCNFLHLNSIWKDIPYTFSMLWLFIILAKLSLDYEKYKGAWYVYFELIVAFVGIYFYRKNGFVVFILTAIAMVILLRKNIKVWCTVAISIIAIMFIKGPVYHHFEFVDFGVFGAYSGLGQDMLGVYYNDGKVNDDVYEMIEIVTDGDPQKYRSEFFLNDSHQEMGLDVTHSYFIKNYLDTFFKNPALMIRCFIAREDCMWNIFWGEEGLEQVKIVNFVGQTDGMENWNLFYPEHVQKASEPAMMAYLTFLSDTQILGAIIWRSGIWVLMFLVVLIYSLVKRIPIRNLLVAVPILSQLISLCLSCGWSDFRFYWPINLLIMAFFMALPVIRNTTDPSRPL